MNKELLQNWADKYETAQFIKNDPIQIPHRYSDKRDIEISAFVTSWLAWGNRKQIIAKADFIDREIFKGKPYEYIISVDSNGKPLYDVYANNNDSIYRTFKYNDFANLCHYLTYCYKHFDSMEDAINSLPADNALEGIRMLFAGVKGIPALGWHSACKRINMFLRWMVRDSPVDFGIWKISKPSELIIPLDTHVLKMSLRLKLTQRRTPDMITAIEITRKLNEIFPGDPCKGDFALFGYGVTHNKIANGLKDAAKEFNKLSTEIKKVSNSMENLNDSFKKVADLKIIDVINTDLFQRNLKNTISQLIETRKMAGTGGVLRRHPIDRLQERGVFEYRKLTVLYEAIIDKKLKGYSSSERQFIMQVGNEAFNKTMKKLIEDEKERDNSNGNN